MTNVGDWPYGDIAITFVGGVWGRISLAVDRQQIWKWSKTIAIGLAFLAFALSQMSARQAVPAPVAYAFYGAWVVGIVAARGPRPWRISLLALIVIAALAALSGFNSWQLVPRAWSDIGTRWPA